MKPTYFPPPADFVGRLLAHEPTLEALPVIEHHALRPVYSSDFTLLGPGYHAEQKTLVQGDPFDPIPYQAGGSVGSHLELLPRGLADLFADVSFASVADAVSLLALLLTAFLGNIFATIGKPVAALLANQKGVGKTLLARTMGAICDGDEPAIIPLFPDDEEVRKQITARLMGGGTSVLILDNGRSRGERPLGSPFIESQSMLPVYKDRELGFSRNFETSNDFLWTLTANGASLTPDLADRSVVVNLVYEGPVANRSFRHDCPVASAKANRPTLLGELAGIIEKWKEQGRPLAAPNHRLGVWSQIMGGILHACGFVGFLENQAAAIAEIDSSMEEIIALAEYVLDKEKPGYYRLAESDGQDGKRPSDWIAVFREARVIEEMLLQKKPKSQAIAIGKFFGAFVGRPLTCQAEQGPVSATLRRSQGNGNAKLYFFEFAAGNEGEVVVVDALACSPTGRSAELVRPQIAAQEDGVNTTGTPAPHEGTPIGNDLDWVDEDE